MNKVAVQRLKNTLKEAGYKVDVLHDQDTMEYSIVLGADYEDSLAIMQTVQTLDEWLLIGLDNEAIRLYCRLDTKMVIVVRKDLKMRRGKEISQGGHAVEGALSNVDTNSIEYKHWKKTGNRKITCMVNSEEELIELANKAAKAGLPHYLVTDSGRTEFNGQPTKTVVAIGCGRSEEIDKITLTLKLY